MNLKKTARGFTLVELLVVIAIIAILAAVVVLIINPLELMKRSRDAARLTDLANLQTAINVAVQESTQSSQFMACNGVDVGVGLVCGGKSTDAGAGNRAISGNGWVKVDFSTQKSVSVPTLPIDPINSAPNHYTYCGNGEKWEIRTVLESDQQKGKMLTDGGTDDTTYQVGSTLDLTGCAY